MGSDHIAHKKHAIRGIVNVINASYKSKDQPVWALEGDIKGCFDNINHRILLGKLWDIGVHDKRVIQIIKAMLSVGYIEYDMLKNDDKEHRKVEYYHRYWQMFILMILTGM